MIQFWYWGWNRRHPCFQTHQQLHQYYTHNRLDLLPKWLHESKIPKSEKVNFSIFMVSPIESSVQRESSSHPYYETFCGCIPWSIAFLTHFQPHSYDTYIWLHPLSNLRVKSQNFKILVFDIFKKHIRLKKNSATTKLFLFFVIILSTTTFQTLRNKFHRLIDVCCILYQCSLFHQTLPHFYSDVSFPQLLKNFDFWLYNMKISVFEAISCLQNEKKNK